MLRLALTLVVAVAFAACDSADPPAPPPPAVDTTPPSVSITSPAVGAVVSGTVTVRFVATDNVGVSALYVLVDGEDVATIGPATTTWTLHAGSYANGLHTLAIRARDAAGNQAISSVVSLTIRNDAQSVRINRLRLTSFPATNSGAPWDAGDGPDIYLIVFETGVGEIYRTPVREQVAIGSIVEWNAPTGGLPLDMSSAYHLYVSEADGTFWESMGTTEAYAPAADADTRPATVTLNPGSGQVTAEFDLEWD